MVQTLQDGVHSLRSDSQSAQLWNTYVEQSPNAGFYHRFEWKQVNESEFGHNTHYLAAIRGGVVEGVLPLVEIRSRLFGHILCSLPFVNYCGLSASDSETGSQLLQKAYQITADAGAGYMEIRGLGVADASLPVSRDKVSLTLDLASDPDEIWNSFKSKHRNNIRRVYKFGLTVQSGHLDLLDTFYDIMCESWRSLGTPIYRKQYFRSILESFGDKTRIFVAIADGEPVAAAFNGYDGTMVEGMWAGSLFKYRNLQSSYVLYWEMIKHACENGYSGFHLGRSSVESGGEAFKSKWGAHSKQLYWQYYLPRGGEMPQLNVKNPKYALAIQAWRRLPLWATKLIGPQLAKNIP